MQAAEARWLDKKTKRDLRLAVRDEQQLSEL
jgi:hypothetical protein